MQMKIPLPEVQSGKIEIAVNGIPLAVVDTVNNQVSVKLLNEDEIKHLVKIIPRSARHLKVLHRVSAFAERLGFSMDLNDSSGSILKLGKGAHSVLGNVKVKMSRIRRIV
jgi:hypothetical protein